MPYYVCKDCLVNSTCNRRCIKVSDIIPSSKHYEEIVSRGICPFCENDIVFKTFPSDPNYEAAWECSVCTAKNFFNTIADNLCIM